MASEPGQDGVSWTLWGPDGVNGLTSFPAVSEFSPFISQHVGVCSPLASPGLSARGVHSKEENAKDPEPGEILVSPQALTQQCACFSPWAQHPVF